LAAELIGMNVDMIVANSSLQVEAALQVTNKIPIVFCVHGDPVGAGHVASLSHPGGNVTGLSILQTDITVKQLEILTQAVASARRIGVLWNPAVPSHLPALAAIKAAGEKLGIELVDVPARTANDLADAFSTISQAGATAVLVVTSPVIASRREVVAELALKYRLPAMLGTRAEVEAGALMSYGADLDDQFRRAAAYIDKIIKGDKPGDLPVEQASRYRLVINLKTANALGIVMPPELLGRADDVIE
jgi:putative tryptophan/tyrosine transport system substrate-binding protein